MLCACQGNARCMLCDAEKCRKEHAVYPLQHSNVMMSSCVRGGCMRALLRADAERWLPDALGTMHVLSGHVRACAGMCWNASTRPWRASARSAPSPHPLRMQSSALRADCIGRTHEATTAVLPRRPASHDLHLKTCVWGPVWTLSDCASPPVCASVPVLSGRVISSC